MQDMPPDIDFKHALVAVLPNLVRYARALCTQTSEADDLVQLTCERALQRWCQFDPESDLLRWAFTLMNSIFKNGLRHDAVRRGQGVAQAVEVLHTTAKQGPEHTQLLDQVAKHLLELPTAQRQTMVLVYVEGYSYEETSKILDVPKGTVMSRLARARAHLATQLNGHGVAKPIATGNPHA